MATIPAIESLRAAGSGSEISWSETRLRFWAKLRDSRTKRSSVRSRGSSSEASSVDARRGRLRRDKDLSSDDAHKSGQARSRSACASIIS